MIYGYLATPTDQLATPGLAAATEITPEGSLFTGELELAFALGGTAWRQPSRTLDDGHLPVFTQRLRRGGIDATLTVFADGGVDRVRVRLVNRARTGRTARFAAGVRYATGRQKASGAYRFRFLRPVTPAATGLYAQPGSPFDPGWTYAAGRVGPDTAVTREGRVVLLAPPGARITTRAAPSPATDGARAEVAARLRPGAGRDFDYILPVTPLDPAAAAGVRADFSARRAAVAAGWRRTLAAGTRFAIPERRVADAVAASLVQILGARYRTDTGDWVQTVNTLQYHAFWLRDAAVMAHALDVAGLHAEAEEDLRFFTAWQRDDGLFISRPGQYDGMGQALWALGEHVRMTGDTPFARALLPRFDRAVAWIAQARAADPLGLLPASDPHDNEQVAGHLLGDDFWAVAGLKACAYAARLLGDDARAQTYAANAEALGTATARAAAAAAREHGRGGEIPPAVEPGGRDWGNLWAVYPDGPFTPHDPLVTRTVRAVRARFAEGIATYGHALHDYLGFRILETQLRRGEQRDVVAGLYSELAHTTATHGGFETSIRPWGTRSTDDNMAPHGWFSAELVELVRRMILDEEGGVIRVLGDLPPAWLRPGETIGADRAPTTRGPVSVHLRTHRGGATLTWSAPPGVALRWPVPAYATRVRARGLTAGRTTLTVTGHGSRRITWRLRPAAGATWAAAIARLKAGYRARHRPPPSGE